MQRLWLEGNEYDDDSSGFSPLIRSGIGGFNLDSHPFNDPKSYTFSYLVTRHLPKSPNKELMSHTTPSRLRQVPFQYKWLDGNASVLSLFAMAGADIATLLVALSAIGFILFWLLMIASPLSGAVILGVGILSGLVYAGRYGNSFGMPFLTGMVQGVFVGAIMGLAPTYLGPLVIAALGLAVVASPMLPMLLALWPAVVAALCLLGECVAPGFMRAFLEKTMDVVLGMVPMLIGTFVGGLVGGVLGALATPFYALYCWGKRRAQPGFEMEGSHSGASRDSDDDESRKDPSNNAEIQAAVGKSSRPQDITHRGSDQEPESERGTTIDSDEEDLGTTRRPQRKPLNIPSETEEILGETDKVRDLLLKKYSVSRK